MGDSTVSHFRVLEPVGAGGMGEVYRAFDTNLRRTVVLKFVSQDLLAQPEARHRLLGEARSAATLNHPNICTIHEVGEIREGESLELESGKQFPPGTPFIAMELIEGRTLDELLAEKGRLSVEEALDIAFQVTAGLAKAHEQKIVHRDLKPQNVMITLEGHAKILDFGLAKPLFSGGQSTPDSLVSTAPLTREGVLIGTVPYMSPEQAAGKVVDSRSDVFSFGVMLYEMVVGKRPFDGNSPTETLAKILETEPGPLGDHLPEGLKRIVDRCLRKNPKDRYNDTRDLLTELKGLRESLASGTGSSAAPSRKRLITATGVLGLALAAVLLAWLQPWNTGDAPEEPVADADSTHSAPPSWILVSEFDGPHDDPNLALAARELVLASLAQSEVVTPISRPELRRGLELAFKPETTRVVGEVARELALRAGARTYVEGRVDRVMTGYSVVLNTLDAESGTLVASVNGTAANQEVLLATLDTIAKSLREELGENPEHVQAMRPIREVFTPSLEAYMRYTEASELSNQGQRRASLEAARAAVSLDPEFAMAWNLMAVQFANLGHRDSARVANAEAMKRPDRLTSIQRFSLQGLQKLIEGDYREAHRIYSLAVKEDSDNPGPWTNLGFALHVLGEFEKALNAYNRAGDASPFGPSQLVLGNQSEALINLGRYAEAREVVEKMEGRLRGNRKRMLAFVSDDPAEIETFLGEYEKDPLLPDPVRSGVGVLLLGVQAARGSVVDAVREYDRLFEEVTSQRTDPRLMLTLAYSEMLKLPPVPEGSDTTTKGLLIQGILAGASGDVPVAAGIAERLKTKPVPERNTHATDIAFLSALLLAHEEDWTGVLELVESKVQKGQGPAIMARTPLRFMTAKAHEELGNMEEAAKHYELALSPLGVSRTWERISILPFGHYRLVLIYTRLGQEKEAREHWEALQRLLTNPDTELVPILEEAGAAITQFEGKA